jgi:hypothetical protein
MPMDWIDWLAVGYFGFCDAVICVCLAIRVAFFLCDPRLMDEPGKLQELAISVAALALCVSAPVYLFTLWKGWR